MSVSDEAVEAAARFLGDVIGTGAGNWEEHTSGARELLDLVAPHLMAQAWDDAMASLWYFPSKPTKNPYRSDA